MTKEIAEAAQYVAPNVEGKLVEMLDALQHGVVKVGETVVQYSPDIADAALWVVRIDGIQFVMIAISCLLWAIFAKILGKKLWVWARKVDPDFDSPAIAVPVIVWASGVATFGIALAKLFSIWNWVAIFEPKLWLAKQIISSVLR